MMKVFQSVSGDVPAGGDLQLLQRFFHEVQLTECSIIQVGRTVKDDATDVLTASWGTADV